MLTPSKLLETLTVHGGDPPPHLLSDSEADADGEQYLVWYCTTCEVRFATRDSLPAILAAVAAHWHDGYPDRDDD